MALLEKVFVSVLSTVIFSLSLEAVESYDGSFSLGVAFVYAIYSFPIYLIGGGLYAYVVDTYIDKIKFRHAF